MSDVIEMPNGNIPAIGAKVVEFLKLALQRSSRVDFLAAKLHADPELRQILTECLAPRLDQSTTPRVEVVAKSVVDTLREILDENWGPYPEEWLHRRFTQPVSVPEQRKRCWILARLHWFEDAPLEYVSERYDVEYDTARRLLYSLRAGLLGLWIGRYAPQLGDLRIH